MKLAHSFPVFVRSPLALVLPALLALLVAAPAFAAPSDPTTTTPPPDTATDASGDPTPTERSPGFHRGALIFSMLGGPTLGVSNSYVEHEKAYDNALRLQIQQGNVPVAIGSTTYPGWVFSSRYHMNPIIQFDYERARFSHVGWGFSLFHYSVDSQRQEVRPGVRSTSPTTFERQDYAMPVPQKSLLFMTSGVMLQAVFHPLTETFIDPYIAVKGGIAGHTGTAHAELYADPARYDNTVRNGVGLVGGAGLGFNLYMSRYFGFKFEGTFLRHSLHSDIYSSRMLDSSHFQIGIFVSLF